MKDLRWKIAQWFENKWWKHYLRKKDTKKYLEWKNKYWQDFLHKISFKIDPNSNVLDIGCGPAGIYILSNKDKTNNWTALDPLILEYENLTIFNQSSYSKVNFITNSFENYNTDNKFDIIFCINAINHFKNIDNNLSKLNRLLSSNSKLILSIDTHNFKFLKWIFYAAPFDILHPHQYTEIEYEQKFKKRGFSIINKQLIKKEFIFSYYSYILKSNAN